DEEIARLERELAALEEEKRRLDEEFAAVGAGFEDHSQHQEGAEEPWKEGACWYRGRSRARTRWTGWDQDPQGFAGFAAAMASRLSVIGARLGETMSDAFSGMHFRATDTIERSVPVDGPVAVRVENFAGWVAVRPGPDDAVSAVAERYAPRDADLSEITLDVRPDGPGRVAVVCAGTGAAWFARHARLTVSVPS